MFKAQNATASIFIGVSIGAHDPGHSDRLWRRFPKEIVVSRLLRSLQNSSSTLRVGQRIAGVDHAKLRELLLDTSRTFDLLLWDIVQIPKHFVPNGRSRPPQALLSLGLFGRSHSEPVLWKECVKLSLFVQ